MCACVVHMAWIYGRGGVVDVPDVADGATFGRRVYGEEWCSVFILEFQLGTTTTTVTTTIY